MRDDQPDIFVAKFRDHPLGRDRYVKDFLYKLIKSEWWEVASEEQRKKHFAWALNHSQYHYSTADINDADLFWCDGQDAVDRDILTKYAPVDYVSVKLMVTKTPVVFSVMATIREAIIEFFKPLTNLMKIRKS